MVRMQLFKMAKPGNNHLYLEYSKNMFTELCIAFRPVIKDTNFLITDKKPVTNDGSYHPQFTLELENGDMVTIWTQ
jgi:hypothetical protein